MTKEKIIEVVAKYRKDFQDHEIRKGEFPKDGKEGLVKQPASMREALSHCNWMLDQIEKFIQEGRMDKAFRWLGFIQGVFWYSGKFTIEDLSNHNKP